MCMAIRLLRFHSYSLRVSSRTSFIFRWFMSTFLHWEVGSFDEVAVSTCGLNRMKGETGGSVTRQFTGRLNQFSV